MTAPKIYMSSDANAPVMNGTLGSLVNVLNKCLVAGYGDRTPAGWTMPFSNIEETKACFRNNATTGTGFFLRVDHSTSATTPTLKAFENMSDVDTGVDEFTPSTYSVTASTSSGATARPWVLIADDLFFYLVVSMKQAVFPINYTTRYCSFLVFGDINSIYEDDGFCCVVSCTPDTYIEQKGNSCFTNYIASSTGLTKFKAARNLEGTIKNLSIASSCGPGVATGDIIGTASVAMVSGDPIILSRVAINNGAANTIRGFWPGALSTCAFRPNWNTGDVVTVLGEEYWAFIFEIYNTGVFLSFLIKTSDWRL